MSPQTIMVNFTKPLPVPKNAIGLTASEKKLIGKYLDRVELAKQQQAVFHEALSDICMAIAARAGRTEESFKLSADLGCLIPDVPKE